MSYQGSPYPGPTPNYTQGYPPVPYNQNEPFVQPYSSDVKNPYDEGRFKPKKTINDPIPLTLFVAMV